MGSVAYEKGELRNNPKSSQVEKQATEKNEIKSSELKTETVPHIEVDSNGANNPLAPTLFNYKLSQAITFSGFPLSRSGRHFAEEKREIASSPPRPGKTTSEN